MEAVTELLRQTEAKLAGNEGGVSISEIIAAAESEGNSTAALDSISVMLRDRATALKEARSQITQLRVQLDHLKENFAFTSEGWPQRRDAIEEALRTDPLEGLAVWLEEWFQAASRCRTDAMRRLHAVEGLPPGGELLVERCWTAGTAIEQRWWELSEPVLSAGAEGVLLAGRTVPAEPTRGQIRLLLARLAIVGASSDAAEEALEKLDSPTVEVAALRARFARLQGRASEAERLLAQASVRGSEDLDVAVELIENAREDHLEGLGLEAARTAVGAVVLLSDVDPLLQQLMIEPPAEIWIAVSERALREQDLDLHLRALSAAAAAATPDDLVLQAVVAELNARSATERNAPRDEVVDATLDAGIARVTAGQLDAAVAHFEEVTRLDPNHVDARMRLADCLVAIGSARPLSEGRPMILQALELIASDAAQGLITPDLSWSYVAAAGAHARLAGAADDTAAEHAWRRLIAVERALVYELDSASRWVGFAEAADTLGLYVVAHAVAAHAADIDPSEQTVIDQHTQELVNGGHLQEALARLEGATDPWDQAAEGFVLANLGRMIDAANRLRTTPLNPEWFWASQTLMAALILTDRLDEARAEAERAKEVWGTRLDESEGCIAVSWAAMTLGDFDEAQTVIARLAPGAPESMPLAGCVLLLVGETEQGLAHLETWLESTAGTMDLNGWSNLDEPVLRVIADRYGVELPSLEKLDSLAAKRRAEIGSERDAVVELRESPAEGGSPNTVALAKALGVALLLIARGDHRQALERLEEAARERPDDVEISMLQTHVREGGASGLVTEDAHALQEAADEVLAQISTGSVEDAIPALRRLLDQDAWSADDALRASAGADAETLATVSTALELLLEDDDYKDRASLVLGWLSNVEGSEESSTEVDRPLQVTMPASWFAGHSDPLADHELFVRYLPEVRLRATCDVPPIHVNPDVALEPGDYRIAIRGTLVESGTASPDFVYASPAALDLLGAPSGHELVPELDLAQLALEHMAAAGPLGRLLTMPAAEVVARRIALVAESHDMDQTDSSGVTASSGDPAERQEAEG